MEWKNVMFIQGGVEFYFFSKGDPARKSQSKEDLMPFDFTME